MVWTSSGFTSLPFIKSLPQLIRSKAHRSAVAPRSTHRSRRFEARALPVTSRGHTRLDAQVSWSLPPVITRLLVPPGPILTIRSFIGPLSSRAQRVCRGDSTTGILYDSRRAAVANRQVCCCTPARIAWLSSRPAPIWIQARAFCPFVGSTLRAFCGILPLPS